MNYHVIHKMGGEKCERFSLFYFVDPMLMYDYHYDLYTLLEEIQNLYSYSGFIAPPIARLGVQKKTVYSRAGGAGTRA